MMTNERTVARILNEYLGSITRRRKMFSAQTILMSITSGDPCGHWQWASTGWNVDIDQETVQAVAHQMADELQDEIDLDSQIKVSKLEARAAGLRRYTDTAAQMQARRLEQRAQRVAAGSV